jgi:hypothetical protein
MKQIILTLISIIFFSFQLFQEKRIGVVKEYDKIRNFGSVVDIETRKIFYFNDTINVEKYDMVYFSIDNNDKAVNIKKIEK